MFAIVLVSDQAFCDRDFTEHLRVSKGVFHLLPSLPFLSDPKKFPPSPYPVGYHFSSTETSLVPCTWWTFSKYMLNKCEHKYIFLTLSILWGFLKNQIRCKKFSVLHHDSVTIQWRFSPHTQIYRTGSNRACTQWLIVVWITYHQACFRRKSLIRVLKNHWHFY